jgi:hypothetical protein
MAGVKSHEVISDVSLELPIDTGMIGPRPRIKVGERELVQGWQEA